MFLVGCNMTSDNFERISAKKLKLLFKKTSKSKLAGVGIGTLSTAIIQSSGATSVAVIGLVNASIITLEQATTIIFGANIGTTITGQITALGLLGDSLPTDIIFSSFAGIGVFITMLAKKETPKRIGSILTGFGILFVGLNLMNNSMTSLKNLDTVKTFLSTINSPIALVIIGTLITGIIQSSSVITSIAITMVHASLLTLDQGIYLTMGSNIGSCVVAMIASMQSSINAKRTARIHLDFNVIGVIIFLIIGYIIFIVSKGKISYGSIFEMMFPTTPQVQLAMFHTIFNVVSVIIMLPFTKTFVKWVCATVKDKKRNNKNKSTLNNSQKELEDIN